MGGRGVGMNTIKGFASLYVSKKPRDVPIMDTILRGSNSTIFFVSFPFNGGQLLRERICFSRRSKFFPLRVDPI